MANILDPSYQELEYITAGNGPCIQIAYNTGNITKLEFRAKFYANQNFAVFGNGPSSSSSYIGCRFFRSGSTTYCGHNTNRSELSVTYPTEFVNCSVEKTRLVVGSNSYTLSYNGSSTSNYISFFKDRDFANEKLSLAHMKLYNANGLAYNLIPCYRKSDNAIGMYDMVSKTFYGNSGTGNFEKGPEVHEFVTYKTVIYNAIKGFNDIQNTLSNLSDLSIAATSGGNNAIAVNDIVRNINKCATVKKNDGSFVVGKIPVYSPADDGGK